MYIWIYVYNLIVPVHIISYYVVLYRIVSCRIVLCRVALHCIVSQHILLYVISGYISLTHWGRVTHICVSKLTTICSDNGLSPDRHQAIIWTNAGILLIRTLETNFSDFLSEIRAFSFKKMHLKMSSGKWRPFCLGLNKLNHYHMNAAMVLLHRPQLCILFTFRY